MHISRRVLRPLSQAVNRLDHYSQYHPTAISMKKYIEFGKEGDAKSSFMFLRKELLVRMANIMKEIQILPPSLLSVPSAQAVQTWYLQSFEQLLPFEAAKPSDALQHDFADSLKSVLKRHDTVVETMAEALLEWRDQQGVDPSTQESLQYFLDRFYLNRISIRMLMNQHLTVFSSNLPDSPSHVGMIDPECDVVRCVEDAFDNAQFLCDRYYLTSPQMKLDQYNAVDEGQKIRVQIVPSHLYHILFELFKNAMRATVEFSGADTHADDLPPISVMVVKGNQDLSIKVSDQGGGVNRSTVNRLFNYMYSTAPRPEQQQQQAPLAGYGYGLPLSRLYARYFNGDLEIQSMEGLGSDAMIYLKARSNEAQERVPIYGAKSISRLKHGKQAHDYTDIDSTNGTEPAKPQSIYKLY